MANDNWITVDGYPNYRVNDDGLVQSKARGEWRDLKPGFDRYGYPRVDLYNNGRHSSKHIHQLVAKAFVDGYDESLQVNHINGDKNDNRASNLEWVTCGDNLRHAYNEHLNFGPRKSVRVLETNAVYASEKECAIAVGGCISGVNGCLKRRRSTHKGFHYEYVD